MTAQAPARSADGSAGLTVEGPAATPTPVAMSWPQAYATLLVGIDCVAIFVSLGAALLVRFGTHRGAY
ncbi:MAG: hypothetical protein ACYDAQ_01575 [Mycobacteriales bacterium]